MTKCAGINSKILTWARETAGISIADIEKNKNLKKVLLWESGKEYPTYIQLEKLSNKYKRPIAIFFFPTPPEEDKIEKSFRTIPSSELIQIPPEMRFLLRKGKVFQMNLLELNNGENPSGNQFIIDKIKLHSRMNLQNATNKVREFLGLSLEKQKQWSKPEEALKKLRELIEKKGIFIFKAPFGSHDYSGFCLYDKIFPIIYINSSSSKTRQVFTLFHELAHLLYQENHIDLTCSDIQSNYANNLGQQNKIIEIFCNKFAAEFLVPSNDFKLQVKDVNLQDDNALKKLAETYNVSKEVILRKCLDNTLVTKAFYQIKTKEWRPNDSNRSQKKHSKSTGPTYYTTKISHLGNAYLNLVFSRYLSNKISINQTADYLDINVKSVEKLEAKFLAY